MLRLARSPFSVPQRTSSSWKNSYFSTKMAWDPQQYGKFEDARLRPALELLDRIPTSTATRVCDLGCGTGVAIPYLKRRWPGANVIGVDSSGEMIQTAQVALSTDDTVCLEVADLIEWLTTATAQSFDVIFCNAVLHWVKDHALIMEQFRKSLRQGGTLAIQMPNSYPQPSHALMREIARKGPWSPTLRQVEGVQELLDPKDYYELLSPLFSSIDIWETKYLQVLEGSNPVYEFTKGSGLRPYLDALSHDPDMKSSFDEEYSRRIKELYPKQSDGKTLFPFGRLFLVATV
eukprot:gb/GECG01002409.1/.p1 GENE.gb/GECG01002409.1/~~gb/GECG01002409.1/.p1  ORF type:complete len:290 (+),score=22.45 gb/GECG01002409.1/:1-870(+)